MKYQQKNGQFRLTEKEIQRLIGGAEETRDRIMIQLLYYCALRRAEVVRIQRKDIDLSEKVLSVHGKGDKRRLVPIPSMLAAELKNFLRRGLKRSAVAWLFPAKRIPREHLHVLAVNYALRKASERSNVQNPNPRYKWVNPHLLRHSAARRLKEGGIKLEDLREYLGHENIKTTAEHYGMKGTAEILKEISNVWS